ncbi:DUF4928 family protein [Nocardioides hwasunensis]|uniref:DUF4928 family protein n=1 Tax=Nocardioides hwasunensis TaxID=397258 RepID=A0ABR8MM69_9ACTN|nr:DUF4928 family protein [Nocardioides hwasunensis]MBD3915892.1 DUF4928 family protein [Nocardioides hwasunensis]
MPEGDAEIPMYGNSYKAGEIVAERMLVPIGDWFEDKRTRAGRVNTNVMTVGLMLTEHMATVGLPMTEADFLADSQVRGLGGRRIETILSNRGEFRPFTSEGGRTSRGSAPLARQLAAVLNRAAENSGYHRVGSLSQERARVRIQEWFVARLQVEYFNQQGLRADLDPQLPMSASIAALLDVARRRGGNLAGAVAQHLVGAKLCLRFPSQDVENMGYTVADQQTDRAGDFTVGDTAIHVTMVAGFPLFEKCKQNIRDGFRPLILVPSYYLVGTRQQVSMQMGGERMSVQAVEDFVGTNVEEMGGLTSLGIRGSLRDLLMTYNERVAAIEPDPSLLIVIPSNL